MNIKNAGIILSVLMIFMVFLSVMHIRHQDFKDLPNFTAANTKVAGLKPGTKVSYFIAVKTYESALENEGAQNYGDTVYADKNGVVSLPFFQSDFEKYTIFIDDPDHPVNLNVTYNTETARFNIKGAGFEKFADVFIDNNQGSRTIKTDWAGLFSDYEYFLPRDFERGRNIKVAFQGFALDEGIFDQNPIRLEVVIGQGGGPTNANVNVYNPVIHDYACGYPTNSTNGDTMFYVSTCDQARMQTPAMEEGTCTGGSAGPPPVQCTSSADGFVQLIVHPLMLMGEQLSAVMMQQMQAIGSLMDAKEQNEAQRDFRHLVAVAHKDYHPSEQMCRFGTYVRSVSHAEEKADTNKKSFDKILLDYYRSPEHMSSSDGYSLDVQSRLTQFKSTYCNPNENNGALWEMCRGVSAPTGTPPAQTAAVRERYNKDIDYFRTLMKPLTLDVDFNNAGASNDEEDLIALAKNLYWPKVEDLADETQYDDGFSESFPAFMSTRQLISKYGIAHNSFAHIVGMKSRSENPLAVTSGGAHMKSLLRTFGLNDPDIELLVGNDPSYYAQMEVLTKKIYQNPTFYTNLYDKPVNVDRINASLQAFQNMQNRDIHESLMRQEMLTSMLVEDSLMDNVDKINAQIRSLAKKAKPINPAGY